MLIERFDEIAGVFRGKRVAVVGDLMLDVYVWGSASRISQEAPVPIVHAKKISRTLGGAANVMRNVASLGGKVFAFGIVGDDLQGEELVGLLNKHGIESHDVLNDKERRTIEKKRVLAGGQQLLRIDYEDTNDIADSLRGRLTSRLIEKIEADELDAIIFEDYAKGLIDENMISRVVEAAKAKDIVVALDPHPKRPLNAKGLTLMTPNRSEAYGLAGIYCEDLPQEQPKFEEKLYDVAACLREKWATEYLLITLGAKGMALFHGDKEPVHIPTKAREVFDVSGAGDTVISAFTLALISGALGVEAAEIANHAAGIVVGKIGTVSVTFEELRSSFVDDGARQ